MDLLYWDKQAGNDRHLLGHMSSRQWAHEGRGCSEQRQHCAHVWCISSSLPTLRQTSAGTESDVITASSINIIFIHHPSSSGQVAAVKYSSCRFLLQHLPAQLILEDQTLTRPDEMFNVSSEIWSNPHRRSRRILIRSLKHLSWIQSVWGSICRAEPSTTEMSNSDLVQTFLPNNEDQYQPPFICRGAWWEGWSLLTYLASWSISGICGLTSKYHTS